VVWLPDDSDQLPKYVGED